MITMIKPAFIFVQTSFSVTDKIRKITQTPVINIVFQSIFLYDLTFRMLVNIHFQKWPLQFLKTMFITAVCVIFLIKLRWPKNKSLYDKISYCKRSLTGPYYRRRTLRHWCSAIREQCDNLQNRLFLLRSVFFFRLQLIFCCKFKAIFHTKWSKLFIHDSFYRHCFQ